MCTFKICVCTDNTEPFLKHCVINLLFLLVFILVEKKFCPNLCTINVVYNQVLTSGVFCWSLTFFNVNRFRLAFPLK